MLLMLFTDCILFFYYFNNYSYYFHYALYVLVAGATLFNTKRLTKNSKRNEMETKQQLQQFRSAAVDYTTN